MPNDDASTGRSRDEFSTSSSLIQRVKGHDQEAWRTLSQLYGPLVYHWCRRSGLGAEDSADLVQEVFRSLARHVAAFRKDSASDTFRGWLWTITRNKIRDYARTHGKKPQAAGGTDAVVRLQQVPEQEPETLDDAGRSTAHHRLVRRVMELVRPEFQDHTWRAFLLTAVEGLTSPQAAAELKMTPQAVRKAKSRVLRRIREELGEVDDDC